MIIVKATREGLIGSKTASGYIIERSVPYCALPSAAALRQWVKIYSNGKGVRALVLDVGPWNEEDHPYVFQELTQRGSYPLSNTDGVRPAAESGTDTRGRSTNHAGIDLGEAVWKALGLPDAGGSADVSWEFD